MKKVFQLLNAMVRDGEVPNYAIGGAIAAVFYAEPFSTQDIDVFVMMKTESTGLVTTIPGWNYLKERGYMQLHWISTVSPFACSRRTPCCHHASSWPL